MRNTNIGKVVKEGGFALAYQQYPLGLRTKIREDICNRCYWHSSTFNLKMNGKRLFRIYEVGQIDECFAAYGIDAWTGLPTNK